MHNVKFDKGKLIFYAGDSDDAKVQNRDGTYSRPQSGITLPGIQSVVRRASKEYHIQVEVRNEHFNRTEHCTKYVEGTLHVTGQATTHNLYHISKYILEILRRCNN